MVFVKPFFLFLLFNIWGKPEISSFDYFLFNPSETESTKALKGSLDRKLSDKIGLKNNDPIWSLIGTTKYDICTLLNRNNRFDLILPTLVKRLLVNKVRKFEVIKVCIKMLLFKKIKTYFKNAVFISVSLNLKRAKSTF